MQNLNDFHYFLLPNGQRRTLERINGELFVKFDDIKDFLKPTANTTQAAIFELLHKVRRSQRGLTSYEYQVIDAFIDAVQKLSAMH